MFGTTARQDGTEPGRVSTPAAPGSRLEASEVDDFVHATHEVAANALVHGRAPVTVRVWARAHHLVSATSDRGAGFDDPLAGYVPRSRDLAVAGGRGLWIARLLADRIAMFRDERGFTVQVSTGQRAPTPASLDCRSR